MTADDEELGGELRRLFGDVRLDVHPRADAEAAVVAGARRIRRRRTALATAGGALTAVVLVVGSLLLADMRGGTGQVALPAATEPMSTALPPASEFPSGTSLPGLAPPGQTLVAPNTAQSRLPSTRRPPAPGGPPASRLPAVLGPVLGPTGYGGLELGMSFEAAKATGLLAGADTAPTACTTYRLAEGPSAVSSVYISPTDGIVRFEAGEAHTPENIKLGSTLTQLQGAYRDLARGSSTYTASTGSGGSYVFYLDAHNVVASFELVGPAVPC